MPARGRCPFGARRRSARPGSRLRPGLTMRLMLPFLRTRRRGCRQGQSPPPSVDRRQAPPSSRCRPARRRSRRSTDRSWREEFRATPTASRGVDRSPGSRRCCRSHRPPSDRARRRQRRRRDRQMDAGRADGEHLIDGAGHADERSQPLRRVTTTAALRRRRRPPARSAVAPASPGSSVAALRNSAGAPPARAETGYPATRTAASTTDTPEARMLHLRR